MSARLFQLCLGLGAAWVVSLPGRSALALPPPNDNCAGAEVIPTAGPFPFYTSIVDVKDATSTNDPPLPSCRSVSVMRSVWYKFTPPSSGAYTISASGDTGTTVLDTVMAIYTSSGGCDGSFAQFACNDDQGDCQSAIATTLDSGVTYYIVVWMTAVSPPLRGMTSVQLRVSRPVPPPNDTCAGAEIIPANGPFPYLTAIADTTLATTTGDPPAPSCWADHVRSVWFSFTPAATATYELSLCTNTATTVHETVMAIYTSAGGCGSVFSQLFCNHTIPCANKLRSSITAALSNNVTYDIVAWEGTSGAYTPGETSLQLRIDRFQSPMVTTLPASSLTSTSAVLNGTVNPDGFTLTAWFEWGATTNYGHTTPSTNIPGGTSAVALSQAISGLQAGQSNHFRIVVNSTAGTMPGNDRTFAWSFTPPRFASYLRSDQALVLRFAGQSGQVYFIDASVNFAEWLGLGVAADLGSGLFGLTNSSALAARFYRVRSP